MSAKVSGICLIFLMLVVSVGLAQDLNYKPRELIVRFAPKDTGEQLTKNEKQTLLTSLNAGTFKHSIMLVPGVSLVKLPEGVTVETAISKLKTAGGILYVEPNYKIRLASTFPNDTRFDELWGMHNTGQTGGTADADIDAPEAWDTITDSNVIVAVIDTGVDYTHPDLADNIWINQTEYNGTAGVDDDGNGYIDDIYGYDFCTYDDDANDPDPYDDNGHGTHCAGTIGAVGNNGIGVAGVCWNVKLMCLKFIAASGYGWSYDAIHAIDYAVSMNAKVLSNSWRYYEGNPLFTDVQALKDAVEAAGANGVLFVAAAGNEDSNNDSYPAYPASYDCDNIISVMATDHNDQRSIWSLYYGKASNYGLTTVDLAAPGSDILSCVPGDDYESWDGTSMAAPHVAGACALVWAANPQLTYLKVKDCILTSADRLSSLDGLCVTGGRLNLQRAAKGKTHFPCLTFSKDVQDANCVSPFDEVLQNYLTYNICWDANGCAETNVVIVDYLPTEVEYYTSDPCGTYDQNERTVAWDIGNIGADDSNCVTLTVKVTTDAEIGGIITNIYEIESDNHIAIDYKTTCVACWLGEILYVDADANDGGDGLSWQTAYNNFNDALDMARTYNCYKTIWVAGGTYQPSPPDDQSATFDLVNDVSLYGGFAGWEDSLAQRNLKDPNNETILDGYIPGPPYAWVDYIVSATNLDEITLLDGLTIDDAWNCIYVSGGGLTIANCNITRGYTSGITASNATLNVTHTVIDGAGYPADGINASGSLDITNSCIHRNRSSGIQITDNTGPYIIRNNTIVANTGYGIYCDYSDAEPNINNCIISSKGTNLKDCTAQYSWFTDPCFISTDPNEFHLGPNSPCIDEGNPNFDDFNETDFDGECRVMFGKTALRVDIGADEYYWPKADYDQNGIVNFFDFAVLAEPWRTEDANVNLVGPNEIDINDLTAFCDDWLWVAPWSDLYQSMMCRTGGSGFRQSAQALSLSQAPLQQPLSEADIEQLIDWAEDLWQTDETVKDVISESTWDNFLTSLKQDQPTSDD